ncbi:hypothetical protein B7463_g3124, partial [Scytalidium lignicola]
MRSQNSFLAALVAGTAHAAVTGRASSFNVLDFVNPLIGTASGGHVFPGASLPYGMAKAVADTDQDNAGGYSSNGWDIRGFSHMHDSGTGGSPSLGNFPIFPNTGCPDDDLNQCIYPREDRLVYFDKSTIVATPGYFGLNLDSGIKAEMTTSSHTALYKFTFPQTTTAPMILVDLIDLPNSRSNGTAAVDPNTGRLYGSGTFNPSFGIGTYDLHFCADFSGAKIHDTGVFVNTRAANEPKVVYTTVDGTNSDTSYSAGSFTRFAAGTTEVLVRVGVSFISVNQACSNAQKEVPTYDFDGLRRTAENQWSEKLNVVSVNATGVSTDLQTIFWSGIYRSMLSPQDYTGENPLWRSSEPYYDSYYCIWDSYRAANQLITLVDPLAQSRMVRSLIDIYRHEGYLPDCRMSLCKGLTQGGSNADVIIAEAYLKHIPGIDWNTGYEAVVKDAEVEPLNWGVEGRGGLTSWKSLGFIPAQDFDPLGQGPLTRSISRTIEYAYDDYCIAQMAKGLGKTSDYNKYTARASNWKNLFNSNQTSLGYTGFLQPRFLNGTWGYQDPELCSNLEGNDQCYLQPSGHETYEGSCWLYTFYAPQDMGALVTALGGRDEYTNRLSYLHSSGLLYLGDEQAFLPVYQYHYSGHPGLSSQQVHKYIPTLFYNDAAGIPGNDDSGAMGSFTTLSMMGIWPVPGQTVYLLNPPFFESVSIKNPITGKTATIRNVKFDPSYNSTFIQSAKRDGKPWTNNWIGHDFFENGGVIELTLGSTESTWGTRPQDCPPSLSPYHW